MSSGAQERAYRSIGYPLVGTQTPALPRRGAIPAGRKGIGTGARRRTGVASRAAHRKRANLIRLLPFLMTGAVFFGLLVSIVLRYNAQSVISREMGHLRTEIASLRSDSEYRRIRLLPYFSDVQVERSAVARLGMKKPHSAQVVTIDRSTITPLKKVYAEATPSTSMPQKAWTFVTGLLHAIGQKIGLK